MNFLQNREALALLFAFAVGVWLERLHHSVVCNENRHEGKYN